MCFFHLPLYSLKVRKTDCNAGLERYDDIDDPLFLDYYNVDPIEVLAEASQHCLEEAKQLQFTGSSTALVAVLRRDVLRVANLGDCNCSLVLS